MYQYDTEMIKIPYKLFTSVLTEDELKKMNDRINFRAEYGWELVTYTYVGGHQEVERAIVMTFRKKMQKGDIG